MKGLIKRIKPERNDLGLAEREKNTAEEIQSLTDRNVLNHVSPLQTRVT